MKFVWIYLVSTLLKRYMQCKISNSKPGMVTHIYNPSSPGSGDWKDHSSRPAWVKSSRDSISTNRSYVMVPACYPSYMGSVNRNIAVQAGPGIKTKSYRKNNCSKMGWGHS
jgi:hypothetical protein